MVSRARHDVSTEAEQFIGGLKAVIHRVPPAALEFGLVAVAVVGALVLYSYISIFGSASPWFHDEKEAIVYARDALLEGDLALKVPLNRFVQDPVFTPPDLVSDGDRALPARAAGMYFFTAVGLLLGQAGPFLLVSVMGLIGLVFFYLAAKVLFDDWRIALVAAVLYSTSVPIVVWHNFLLGSAVALDFFVVGMYALAQIVTARVKGVAWFATLGVCLAAAAMVRYEYWLFGLAAVGYLLASKAVRSRSPHLLAVGAPLVAAVTVILALNAYWYGNPLTNGYTKSNYIVPIFNYELLFSAVTEGSSSGTFAFVRDVYFHSFLRPDLGFILGNLWDWVPRYFGGVLPLAMLGFLVGARQLDWRSRAPYTLLLFFGAPLALWLYYVYSGTFWGLGHTDWVLSVYVRYTMPLVPVLAVAGAVGVRYLLRHGPLLGMAGAAMVAVSVGVSLWLSLSGPMGLMAVSGEKEKARDINAMLSTLPAESVVIAPFYEKMIHERPTLSPWYIASNDRDTVRARVLEYARELDSLGAEIYYIAAPWHRRTFLDLVSFARDQTMPVRFDRLPGPGYAQIYRVVFNQDARHAGALGSGPVDAERGE